MKAESRKRRRKSRKPKAESGTDAATMRDFAAFSLLEVILALAILAGSLAIIGEYARQGADNARIAQDLTQAQFLCESKLAEIAAGISAADSGSGESLMTDDEQTWTCDVEATPIETLKLLSVTVTVTKDFAGGQPVSCTITRWIADPNATTTANTSE